MSFKDIKVFVCLRIEFGKCICVNIFMFIVESRVGFVILFFLFSYLGVICFREIVKRLECGFWFFIWLYGRL